MSRPSDKTAWESIATSAPSDIRTFIDGRYEASDSSSRFEKFCPSTGAVVAEWANGSEKDVDRAIVSARRSFVEGQWRCISAQQRSATLLAFADLIADNRDLLAVSDTLDVGKPITQSLDDVDAAVAYIRYAGDTATRVTDELLPTDVNSLSLNVREPVGVVGAIVPWNFPIVAAAIKLGPALAVGNSVVLKPSELSPRSALLLAELAVAAGLPPGALNVVPGMGAEVGSAMSLHPDIDLITFTGSTETGRHVMRGAASSNLKKVILECGGKSPNIILDDVHDLDEVATDVVQQIAFNQGQVCAAGSRLIVHASLVEELVERVVQKMGTIRAGDPLDPDTQYGPLISQQQLTKVMAIVNEAAHGGARIRFGGRQIARDGFYFEPTVIDQVKPHDRIAQDEIFGPVLTVLPFQEIAEALQAVHAVAYGLTARIWTNDSGTAYQLARGIRAGEITVRQPGSRAAGISLHHTIEPFGLSGFGAEGGLEGLRQYTRAKAIQIDLPKSRHL